MRDHAPGHECRFEQDVLDAVRSGRWPFRCDPELATHVDQCPVCADVALVATAFAAEDELGLDRALAREEPVLPPSTLVWWRAQRRAREEALRRATWPVRVAQWVAWASALVVVAAGASAAGGWLWGWLEWFSVQWPDVPVTITELASLPLVMRGALLMGALAALVLTPAVIYLGLSDE